MKLATRRTLVWTLILFLACSAEVAAGDGCLTPELQKQLHDSLTIDAATRALQNAVTNNDVKSLALDRQIIQRHNNVFNHKIEAKGITNQVASGRCWLFASLNLLRPAVIEKYKLDGFEFSEAYLTFWDKLEKANCFLEDSIELAEREPFDRELDFIMRDPITDGGWWRYTVALVQKYGVVPKEIMTETQPSEHTAGMNDVLAWKLRVDAMKLREMVAKKTPIEEIRAAKAKMLAEVYRILVLHYGQPPSEFTYRYVDKDKKVSEPKQYTPKSFYEEWVGVDLDQYVDLCDDPTNPYDKHYRLRRVKGMVGAPEVHYVNLPGSTLKELATKAVLDKQPVLFSADATQDMDRDRGIMQVGLYDYASLFGVDLTLTKANRLVSRQGAANHAMVFIGVDMDQDKPAKWLVENTWGKEKGDGGCWTLYDRWFDEHVYGIVVKKAYLPNNVLEILQQDPVELPPWAPLNTVFR